MLRAGLYEKMAARPHHREGRNSDPVLIDLHCHTRPLSSCSSLAPDELVVLARSRGLDAVCLTEHDRTWSDSEVRQLARQLEFVVLRGMEVTTELGHVLVFGLERYLPEMYFAARLREHVLAAGGIMLLAHPVRAGGPPLERARLAGLFDGVESLNGSDGPAQNAAALAYGSGLALPGVGGSDCHAPREVATAATRLSQPVRTGRELIEELRRGRHQVVDLLVTQRCRRTGERLQDAG